MIRKFVLLIVMLFTGAAAFAAPLMFDGFVSDNAHVLSQNAVYQINSLLLDLQKKTGADIAVVTLKTLNGRSIEDTALEIAREAKLGNTKEDNGALILVVPPEHRMRIEIGYGLEGVINDAKAGRIRDDDMLPYFRNGDYESGIWRGTFVLASEIASSYGVKLAPSDNVPQAPISDGSYLDLLIILLILLLIFSGPGGFFFLPGGRGGGGGISFGGGGGFGGGGASGRW